MTFSFISVSNVNKNNLIVFWNLDSQGLNFFKMKVKIHQSSWKTIKIMDKTKKKVYCMFYFYLFKFF